MTKQQSWPWPTGKEDTARTFEQWRLAHDATQRRHIDRLIDQLTPLAKCPDYISVYTEVGDIIEDWHQKHGWQPNAKRPARVWSYLMDKYEEERIATGDRDFNKVVVVQRAGGPQQFELPYAQLTATEYFAVRRDPNVVIDQQGGHSAEAPERRSSMQRVVAAFRSALHL